MSRIKPSVGPRPGNASSTAAAGQTCPRCGQPLRAEYACGCPERWEGEGGALAPEADEQRPANTGEA
jgi:hypothetical protein